MPSSHRYTLSALVLIAVATGCSGAEEASAVGQAGSAGNLTAGGQPASNGGSAPQGGGGWEAGNAGATVGGGASTAGVGGSAGAGLGGGTSAAGDGGAGGLPAAGGAAGMGGAAGAAGSGGAEALAPGCGNAAAAKGARSLKIQVNGKSRSYLLFVPNGYDPNEPIPLIFAWHGSGSYGEQARRYFKLEGATGDDALIIYPDGLNGAWDLGAEGADVKLFDALLTSTSKEYCVDQARVFTTGYSFGG